ncbi:hypothetical protein Ccrd_014865 [Cynara cardunculus var. scolymus]|uniref:Uncharacterized protein n=1 Tax=Cynara cardunculus var. scolymus TaxID=59895 RepID=A0A118K403_CYNCS|nr:hypothetical protein Ccrd_014865 [Cynara cardunculus var. scolymus]
MFIQQKICSLEVPVYYVILVQIKDSTPSPLNLLPKQHNEERRRDYRMPHNEVDEIDYMAEEGDILDFVMDDEEVNSGGDQIVEL